MADFIDRPTSLLHSAMQAPMARRDAMRWLTLAGASASAAAFIAPSSPVVAQSPEATADPNIQQGGTFQLGIADISSLNPFVSNSQQDSLILNLLYPALGTLDKESNRLPYVAESWESSTDGMTNTFKIREGFLWEDGTPLTAHDVKFTCDLEIEQKFTFKTAILAPVESIEVPDDYTVVFNMSRAVATFIYDVAFWFRIMPKHIWESIDDPKTYTNDQPIGAGPFRLARWEKTQFVELEARKDYNYPPVGRPPFVDKLIYRTYPDVNTLVLAFQNGDIDAVPQGVPVDSVDAIKEDSALEVVRNASTGYNYVAPNIAENPHLANVQVRQAMAMGIDKDVIIQFVFKGSAGKMTTVVSPVLTFWNNPEVEDWPFDIEAGRQMLEEAGYTDTDGDGFVNLPEDQGSGNLEFRLSFAANEPTSQKVAAILKENWEKMGISIPLDAQESNALYQRVRFDRDFELYLAGWGIVDNPPRHYYSTFHPSQYQPGSNNLTGIDDPEFAALIEETHFNADLEATREGVLRIQEMDHELLPVFALYYPEFDLAYNRRWEGFHVLPGSLLGIASWQSMVDIHQATE